jgi:hypothetical protein
MLSMPFLFASFPGQLPVNTHLEVQNILFSEASTALKVMRFDMKLAVATSYNPHESSSGLGTSAWAFIRDYEVDTATLHYSATDIYVIAKTAVSAGARGDVIVMGAVTAAPKVGSAAHVLGQQLRPSMATIGTLAPCATQGTTLRAESRTRKIIALCTNAATAATANVHFNGFGWGTSLFIPGTAALNVDA